MEDKLSEYRKQKQRQELATKTRETVAGFFRHDFTSWLTFRRKDNSKIEERTEPLLPENDTSESDTDDDNEEQVLSDEQIDQISCCTRQTFIKYFSIFIVWAAVFAFFIQWGFGLVYFGFSLLFGIYLNTSTKRKPKNQVSAYSVFNRNCTSIQGTVKAEDLERQMIFGRIL